MAEPSKTFSESWYRIAGKRVALRPHVQLQRQFFRGQKWYVVRDPFNNQFFRLRPEAQRFVARLRPDRTVQEVWEECLELAPDEAPGQQEVIQLLAQLFYANLLQSDDPADSEKLFKRHRKRRGQERRAKLLNVMFSRFPLLDPDRFVTAFLPVVGPLVTPVGGILWLATLGAALKLVVERWSELAQQSQAILAPHNLFLLYVGLVIIKTLHEFGHAFVCRKLGGEVHEMGIMLLIFTPIPYMDATSAWAFRSRWRRALVGAAGILTELWVAAIATFVWAWTGPGTLHSIAYNMMFVASVSTVLFNGNPLLRYDGYYILSDLLDIPNLHGQAAKHLRHLVERYAFGCRHTDPVATSYREATYLTVFGVLSNIYRIIVFGGIVLFVGSRFLLAGLIMGVVCIFSWIVVPISRFVRYLATSPRLERVRVRAIAVTVAVASGVVGLLELTPWPYRSTAPGIVEAAPYSLVLNETAGRLQTVLAELGKPVAKGQPLVRLSAPELAYDIATAEAQLVQARALRRQALPTDPGNIPTIDQHIAAVNQRLNDLRQQQRALVVSARQDGVWTAPRLDAQAGAWLQRGTALGQISDPDHFVLRAVVSQQEAARLFGEPIREAQVRLLMKPDMPIPVANVEVLPAETTRLPSAALGWAAGGDVATDPTDPSGTQSAEPFFQVRAALQPPDGLPMRHGLSGRIRFEYAPEPLLRQWRHKLRQLIQKRYQL